MITSLTESDFNNFDKPFDEASPYEIGLQIVVAVSL